MPDPFITVTEAGVTADARGTAVITAACDAVRLFTDQQITPVVNGGTAILDGTGTDALLLPQRPVLNAGTVIENVGYGNAGTLTLDTDYKLNGHGILLRLPGVIDSGFSDMVLRTYWPPGRQNIQVTYSYGYSTAPSELKEVAVQMAKRLYAQDGNVVFEKIGQREKRWSGPATDWTSTEKIILADYKSRMYR